MKNLIIELITLCINFSFIYVFSNIFLTMKKVDRRLGITYVTGALLCIYANFRLIGISINDIGLILSLLFILLVFEDKLQFKIFVLAVFFLLSYSLEVFIAFSTSIASSSSYTDFINTKFEMYNLTLALLRMLLMLIYKYLVKIGVARKKIVLRGMGSKYIIFLILILMASFAFTVFIDYMLTDVLFLEFNIPITFLLFTLFMASVILIGILIMVQKSYKENLLSSNNRLLEVQLKSQLDHYNHLKRSLNETRKIKHDMLNHMNSLKYLIKKNAIDEALEYIHDIDDKLGEIASSVDTGNIIFDAIYIEKSDLAKSKGIEFINKKCMNHGLGLRSVDICTIVSNSMDNAIEACSSMHADIPKQIQVESYVKNDFWVYKLVNTAPNVKIKNNCIATTKADKAHHGFGLLNIKEAVEKYDGKVDIAYDNNQFVLEVVILNKSQNG